MFIRIDSEEERYIPSTINGIPIIECMNDKTHLTGKMEYFLMRKNAPYDLQTMIEHGENTGRFIDPCPVLEVKEIPARKVDEGCKHFQKK